MCPSIVHTYNRFFVMHNDKEGPSSFEVEMTEDTFLVEMSFIS